MREFTLFRVSLLREFTVFPGQISKSLFHFSFLHFSTCFKVPLALFKREKEVARRLEFDGLYLSEQPEDDDLKAHWDKLVISAKSFPALYWDKFVKKRVRQKFSDQFEFDALSNTLGMEKSAIQGLVTNSLFMCQDKSENEHENQSFGSFWS